MTWQPMSSWGNLSSAAHQVTRLASRHASLPDLPAGMKFLPYGNGRSYGDSCLNAAGALVETRQLDRFIDFDADTGTLACESGVLLADISRVAVPQGWFLPVTPGTQFVTVGGAIANDVHGKNHHRAGTFARHLRRFELLRSDGERIQCSQSLNPQWFAATVGGLGLTGAITWAELQLHRVESAFMDVETIRFSDFEEFLVLAPQSDREFDYTVAWIDCLSGGRHLGRGLLQRANHAKSGPRGGRGRAWHLAVPVTPPFSMVNEVSLRIFNAVYYHRMRGNRTRRLCHYQPFFYPLDGLERWNRLYGPRGLYQYQCVVPHARGPDAVRDLLRTISRSRLGSMLAVLKLFGELPSPGMLSFPMHGITLALDFPNRGERLEGLFRQLDAIVQDAGGRLYPAKDARMPGSLFRSSYPRWRDFSAFIDPRCSSGFWRRVTGDA